MSEWKMVPVELTPEMESVYATAFISSKRFSGANIYADMLAAAPAFEPDDAMVERALETFCCVGPTDKHAMRAALKAAIGGHDDH